MVLMMHEMPGGKIVPGRGWRCCWRHVQLVFENRGRGQAGDHTPVVQLHQRYGMILFIASEVMFFVGWFWAFFDFSLFPPKWPRSWVANGRSRAWKR
jgi:cytochrome c oxidase subunit 3